MTPDPAIGYRLSPLQERIWQLSRKSAGPVELRIEALLPTRKRLDSHAVQHALDLIASSYEILRTDFIESADGTVSQVVRGTANLAVSAFELCETDPLTVHSAVRALLEASVSEHDRLPLCSVAVVSAGPTGNYLYLNVSPLIVDRRSVWMLAHAVIDRCAGNRRIDGRDTLQYADIAEWKHALFASDEAADGKLFWVSQMSNADAWRPLASARTPRALDRFEYARLRDCSLPARIDEGRQSPSVEAIALGCWAYVAAQYLNASDVVIGVVSDSRAEEETQTAIGPMTATLPLSVRLDPSERFGGLCSRLDEALATARAWQDVFGWKHLESAVAQDGRATFCRMAFEFVVDDAAAACDPAWSLSELRADSDRYELKLVCAARDGHLTYRLDYDRVATEEAEAARLLACFERTLEAALGDVAAPVGTLERACEPLAVAADRQLNDTAPRRSECGLLTQIVERQVRSTPDSIAVVEADAHLTYRELDRRATRLAQCLRGRGLAIEECVGIRLRRSASQIVAMLAVLKAGGVIVPLENAPPGRLREIVTTARIRLAFADEDAAGLFAQSGTDVMSPETLAPQLERPATFPLRAHIAAGNLAYVLFTSGSTGTPKGVMVPHEGLVNYLAWAGGAYDCPGTAGSIVHSTIDFDFTMTALFLPLACGRTVLLAPPAAVEFIGHALSAGSALTFMKLTPAHLRSLQYSTSLHRDATRLLVLGGEPLMRDDLQWLGTDADVAVVNEYGPTEASVGCCVYRAPIGELLRSERESVPIGRPIGNTSLHLLTTSGSLAWPGAAGEIWIGGKGLARGYIGRPDLTAAAFGPDPYPTEPGARAYRTGDLGRLLPDGNLLFLGRIDTQVKISGYRVELEEIAHIAMGFPGVTESVALVTGESAADAQIALAVRNDDAVSFDADALRLFLVERLPAYMLPRAVLRVAQIPLTAHGKTDRAALAAQVSGPRSALRSGGPATTPVERDLADIWKHVLNLTDVGSEENFFTLGGDSIRSIQVLGLAKRRGYELSLADILESPTIRTLARRMGAADAERIPAHARLPFGLLRDTERASVPDTVEDVYPMAAMQEGMLFHSEWDEESAVYHDIVSVHVAAPYEREALESCLGDVIASHAVLRTVFDLHRFDRPMQLVLRHTELALVEEDLRGSTPDEQEARIGEWLAAEKRRRFSWHDVPPLRFSIHRREPGSFQFSISFHHALLDGWSTATLLVEVLQRYGAACGLVRRPSELAPRSTFRDFIYLEQSVRQSQTARQFWRAYLEDAPTTQCGRALQSRSDGDMRVRRHEFAIRPELLQHLVSLAHRLGVPLKSVLLAGHVKVVSTLVNRAEVVTGSVSSGRVDEVDGDRALGLFLNTLPVRCSCDNRTWLALIRHLYDNDVRCVRYRRLPLSDMLREASAPDLFDTAFNFVHYHLYGALGARSPIRVLQTYAFEETSLALLANFIRSGASDRLTLLLDVDTRASARRLETLAAMYEQALEALVSRPDALVQECDILPAGEQDLLRCWARGARPPEPLRRPDQRMAARSREAADRVALVCGDRHLSYRMLVERARRVAAWLEQRGIGHEDVVALDMDRSIELLLTCCGTILAGAAYISLDRSLPDERRRFILSDSSPSLIVTDRDPALFGEEWRPRVQSVRELLQQAIQGAPARPRAVDLDGACYLVYTSGSTGAPKGIVMPHRPLTELLGWQIDVSGLTASRTLQHTSLSFDVSYQEIFGTLGAGGTLVLIPEAVRDRPERMWDLLRREEVERMFLPCAALRQLTTIHEEVGESQPLSLTHVITAGDVLHLTPGLRAFFANHPSLTLTNQYGPAETHVVTSCTLDGPCDTWPARPAIGRPVGGAAAVYVLDERLHAIPIGTIGEIYLGDAAVSRGYVNRPELTAERFIPDPHPDAHGGRLYRTGDLAWFDEHGALEFVGRTDHQVKVLGHRVELGEVETVLERMPGIAEAVVEHHLGSDGEHHLRAYVVPRPGAAITIDDVRAHLAGTLPRYMVPARFVMMTAMPRTVGGKIDRKKLHAANECEPRRRPAVPPANPIEAAALELWRRVLDVSDLGVEDDFFEAGGHSLSATRIVVALRATFQVELSIKSVFELRSVRAMSAEIAARLRQTSKAPDDSGQARAETDVAADGPHGPLEQEIAAMFEEVLGVRAVTRQQRFFDLGGSPLRAMRCLRLVDDRYRVQISLSELASASLADLATLIDARRAAH